MVTTANTIFLSSESHQGLPNPGFREDGQLKLFLRLADVIDGVANVLLTVDGALLGDMTEHLDPEAAVEYLIDAGHGARLPDLAGWPIRSRDRVGMLAPHRRSLALASLCTLLFLTFLVAASDHRNFGRTSAPRSSI